MREIKMTCLFMVCFGAAITHAFSQTIVNEYAAIDFISSHKGSTTLEVDIATGFSAGDRVIVMQMKGAKIKTADDANFGAIDNYNNTGNYEFNTILSIESNVITLACPLSNTYSPSTGKVQLIKVFVPTLDQNDNYEIKYLLTAKSWNGETGGVLAIETSGNLILSNDIDVSGKGFRGGRVSVKFENKIFGTTSYRFPYSTNIDETGDQGGEKGEGIAAHPFNMESGRGYLANGGGGGNAHNCGGGGGGNGGKGGHGGHEAGGASNTHGGLEGTSLNYQSGGLFMGGGGGGAHINNGGGSKGENGGGIVIIKANNIVPSSTYSIMANGLGSASYTGLMEADGQGGAGAGGTIVLELKNPYTNGQKLLTEANGGKGGDVQWTYRTGIFCGPGGGGGGGAILHNGLSSSYLDASVKGGLGGISKDKDGTSSAYGATNGSTGIVLSSFTLNDGCTSTAIEEDRKSSFALYPIPSNGILHILTSETFNIALADINGKMLPVKVSTTANGYSVDISMFSKGIYQLLLTDDASGEIHIQKIIKN